MNLSVRSSISWSESASTSRNTSAYCVETPSRGWALYSVIPRTWWYYLLRDNPKISIAAFTVSPSAARAASTSAQLGFNSSTAALKNGSLYRLLPD